MQTVQHPEHRSDPHGIWPGGEPCSRASLVRHSGDEGNGGNFDPRAFVLRIGRDAPLALLMCPMDGANNRNDVFMISYHPA